MRIQDQAPLGLIAVTRGTVHVVPVDADPVRLGGGDVAIVRGPAPYVLASAPDLAPQLVVHPGQRCTTVDGRDMRAEMDLGVRTWGTDPAGSVSMLFGVYEDVGTVGRRLLDALPERLVLPEGACDAALVELLAREMGRDVPGQSVVLDRLLDLLLVTVLRAWLDRPEAQAPAWYRAAGDPVVGRALQLLHENTAHPWTVAELAARVGVSRAALARSFSALVDVPPMTYLTEWRLALAADLLREPDLTLDAVARRVGYSNGFALSTAFKRQYGLSPAQYRAAS